MCTLTVCSFKILYSTFLQWRPFSHCFCSTVLVRILGLRVLSLGLTIKTSNWSTIKKSFRHDNGQHAPSSSKATYNDHGRAGGWIESLRSIRFLSIFKTWTPVPHSKLEPCTMTWLDSRDKRTIETMLTSHYKHIRGSAVMFHEGKSKCTMFTYDLLTT